MFAEKCVGLSLAAIMFIAGAAQRPDGGPPPLRAGDYELRIVVKDAPEEQRDKTMPVKVATALNEKEKLEDITLEWQREKFPGEEVAALIKFRGIIDQKKIKFFHTDFEHKQIVSLCFVGEMVAPDEAKGTLTISSDGENIANGEWTLVKKKSEK